MRLILVGNIASVHVSRWADFLVRQGHEVHAFSDVAPDASAGGLDVHLLPGSGLPKAVRFALAAPTLSRLIDRIRPDAVHVQSVGVTTLLASAVPDRLLVVSPWGSEVAAARGHPLRGPIARSTLRRASLVLTTSRSMADEVATHFGVHPTRIAVVSWGVDPRAASPLGTSERMRARGTFGLPADALVVTAIRSLSPVYRTIELVRAFSDCMRPGMHLVLLRGYTVHDGRAARVQARYRRDTLALVQRLPAGSWTYIDRPLDGSEFLSMLGASDVAVSVPRSDQRSTSVLESLGMGITLVAADLPPYRELEQDGFALRLLNEPIGLTVAKWLATPDLLSDIERLTNVALVSATENRFERYGQMVAAIAERG